MSKTLKIGRASFIGGGALCLVALLVAPAFWWLGIIAGFAAGYLSYQFRDVLAAAAKAYAAACEKVDIQKDLATDFLAQPHPFGYPAFVIVAVAYIIVLGTAIQSATGFMEVALLAVILLIPAAVGFFLLFCFFVLPAVLGAKAERKFWCTMGNLYELKKLTKAGFEDTTLTYRNAYRWMFKGWWVILSFVLWRMWWMAICVIFLFIFELIRLIHSNERLLCAVDGTLGGLIALWLSSQYDLAASASTSVFIVLCGGAIGAALGVANWEIISKRYFGFEQQT